MSEVTKFQCLKDKCENAFKKSLAYGPNFKTKVELFKNEIVTEFEKNTSNACNKVRPLITSAPKKGNFSFIMRGFTVI